MPSPASSVRFSALAFLDGARAGLDSQRVDVHPYEEAQGFQRLLDIPGYDVAALVEKSARVQATSTPVCLFSNSSPLWPRRSHRSALLPATPTLIARLPQESQAEAFDQCWRKDWQDKEPHLLPAKHVAAWIQANLYLSLADAPFDREDPTLNPTAGACVTCPRRSGYNTALFADVVSTSASIQAATTAKLRHS